MRVLLVTHGVKDVDTAVYRNTADRAGFLRQLGHDAQVLAPADTGVQQHSRLLPILYPFAAAWWILRTRPFDVITFHSHSGWVYQVVRAIAPSHGRTRVAVAFHGLDILYVKALEEEGKRLGIPQSLRFRLLHQSVLPRLARWSCRHAQRVFCMNDRERSFLLEHHWTTAECLRWMPNCIEMPHPAEGGQDGPHGSEPAAGTVRLLTVAQWLPVKGIRYLVEAFTAIVRAGHDVQLTCAGTGRDAARVLRDFPEDVRGRVNAIPRFDHAGVWRWYAAADIFVLPSLFEGFSIALLEAMAAGLPIVATSVGAAPQILEHGHDALIVDPANALALESAIASLVTNPARRQRYGRRAHVRAAAFSPGRVLARFAGDLLGADVGRSVTSGA